MPPADYCLGRAGPQRRGKGAHEAEEAGGCLSRPPGAPAPTAPERTHGGAESRPNKNEPGNTLGFIFSDARISGRK